MRIFSDQQNTYELYSLGQLSYSLILLGFSVLERIIFFANVCWFYSKTSRMQDGFERQIKQYSALRRWQRLFIFFVFTLSEGIMKTKNT